MSGNVMEIRNTILHDPCISGVDITGHSDSKLERII